MKKNPGRKERHSMAKGNRRNSDLNRRSTHKMRTNMGIASKKEKA